jgi:cardiolipin synthase
VVDGAAAIVGGTNFGYRYIGPGQWRDTNVLLSGPVVADVQTQFVRDWRGSGGRLGPEDSYFPPLEPTGEATVRAMDQVPSLEDFDINTAMLIALRTARESVLLETPYLNPSRWLLDELLATRERGVAVSIVTNSLESTDFPIVVDLSAVILPELFAGGVRVFLWQPPGRNLHSKLAVVDDRFAMAGSYNLNQRSIAWDSESVVILSDPPMVNRVRQAIETDQCCDLVIEVDEAWLMDFLLTRPDMTRFSAAFGWLF